LKIHPGVNTFSEILLTPASWTGTGELDTPTTCSIANRVAQPSLAAGSSTVSVQDYRAHGIEWITRGSAAATLPGDFSVAAAAVRSDDRRNRERTSSPPRHVVAGHRGILAPLPGLITVRFNQKQKVSTAFPKKWSHN
jgi:hypothetical protein